MAYVHTGRAIGYLLAAGSLALPLCIFAPSCAAFVALIASCAGLALIARGHYE